MGKAEYHKGETTKVESGKSAFRKEVAKIAVPVALQCMLSSSFSMVDQIMVGQLGKESIGAVEIAGKPSFIYAFMLGAIGTVAGIMISQYIGKKDRMSEERSVCVNLLVGLALGVIFTMGAVFYAGDFVRIFSEDAGVLRGTEISTDHRLDISSYEFSNHIGMCHTLPGQVILAYVCGYGISSS